jgi:hypothetical protein
MNKGFVLLMLPLIFAGCQDFKHAGKSLKTSTIGASRTVTLYNHSGQPIKVWKGRMKVSAMGATARFIAEGKVVHISGTFIVQED